MEQKNYVTVALCVRGVTCTLRIFQVYRRKVIPAVTRISCARRLAPVHANRLNPGNNRAARNVARTAPDYNAMSDR